jgi:hypothetical protein
MVGGGADAEGPWIRAAKTVPTGDGLRKLSRRAKPSCGIGAAATAVTGGSCESVRAVCCIAHLLLDGPRGTQRASPRGQFYWRWSRSLRFSAGTGRKLPLRNDDRHPRSRGWLLPNASSLPQGVHRQRKAGANLRAITTVELLRTPLRDCLINRDRPQRGTPQGAQRDRIRTQLPFRSTETLARNVVLRLFIRQSLRRSSQNASSTHSD